MKFIDEEENKQIMYQLNGLYDEGSTINSCSMWYVRVIVTCELK